MAKLSGIYRIVAPDDKIYVGQSKDIHRRWRDYKKLRCKSQTKLYNSLTFFGVNEHSFEILKIFSQPTKKKLDRAEVAFIALYKKKGYKLLNVAPGGSFFYPAWKASQIPTKEGKAKFWSDYNEQRRQQTKKKKK